jgi:diguanylate cyclase (GGDEF)-like protein
MDENKSDTPFMSRLTQPLQTFLCFVQAAWQRILAHSSLRLGLRTLLVGFLVLSSLLVIRYFDGLTNLELHAYDYMVRWRSDIGADPRLLIIEIREKDIQNQQRWPLSDQTIADLLNTLMESEPAAVGLDIYRDFPQPPGNQALIDTFKKHPQIITIRSLGLPGISAPTPAPKGVDENQIGFNDIAQDADGVLRRNLLYAGDNTNETFTSFSMRLTSLFLLPKDIWLSNDPDYPTGIRLGKALFLPMQSDAGAYQQEDTEGYQIMLAYRSTETIAHTVSLTDILEKKVDPELIKGKVVLIGTNASSAKDWFITPYSPAGEEHFYIPGVHIHAYKVSQLISAATGDWQAQKAGFLQNPILSFWYEWQELLWIIIWSILGGALFWSIRRPQHVIIAIVIVLGILIASSLFLFQQAIWIPVIAPLLGFTLIGIGTLVTRYIYYAFYDRLTDLPNRTLFFQRLSHLNEQKNKPDNYIAVILIEVERFKTINVVLGHRVGDQLLLLFAQRLEIALKDNKILAQNTLQCLGRISGTEFGILFNLKENEIPLAANIAQELHNDMTKAFHLQYEDIFTHANIGIAFATPEDKRDLLRDARAAMSRAKLLDKGEPELFETAMEDRAIEQFCLERDLRRVLSRYQSNKSIVGKPRDPYLPEFLIYYQPLIRLDTGCIAGFEALVRWEHPERGIVSPAEFIPVCEETNLIIPIGEWVLRQACLQMRRWQQAFPEYERLIISVNLSSKQFSHPFLLPSIQSALHDSDLSPDSLKLELTESAVMEDVNSTLTILHNLKALNIHLSIDDFGTGYSSLAYLTQFPVDTLKVDQSFIRLMDSSPKNKVIVETIIALAHNMKMEVISEGIETKQQRDTLMEMDSEYGQGYYFAKPLLTEEAEALLAADPRW